MSATKAIQNPEIPGMERILPPLPPPPPPPGDPPVNSADHSVAGLQTPMNPMQNMVHNPVPTPMSMAAPIAYPTTPTPATYYPVMPAQPPPQTNTPWWVPTEVDTNEVYQNWYENRYKASLTPGDGVDGNNKNFTSENYQNWYEARYKAALAAQNDGSKTAKHKTFKRKAEVVDPKLDAEKVANAQRELSALMKPLKCDLCNAVMNSTLQAKLHYQGKPHQKKVSMFLNQSAKKVKADDGQVTSTTANDWNTYCEICKTWFTSQIDAAQHYAGKKHMKAAHGINRGRPNKKNQTGSAPVDQTGRFGIGVSFVAETKPSMSSTPIDPANLAVQTSPVVSTAAPVVVQQAEVPQPTPVAVTNVAYSPTATTYGASLRCDLCGVSTNRLDQLEIHKRGARHLRMLKLNGMQLPESSAEKESISTVSGPLDYSIYRTPSGQYYCAPCNLSLNSESMFAQHIESKKHKNQTNPKAQSGSNAAGSKKMNSKKK